MKCDYLEIIKNELEENGLHINDIIDHKEYENKNGYYIFTLKELKKWKFGFEYFEKHTKIECHITAILKCISSNPFYTNTTVTECFTVHRDTKDSWYDLFRYQIFFITNFIKQFKYHPLIMEYLGYKLYMGFVDKKSILRVILGERWFYLTDKISTWYNERFSYNKNALYIKWIKFYILHKYKNEIDKIELIDQNRKDNFEVITYPRWKMTICCRYDDTECEVYQYLDRHIKDCYVYFTWSDKFIDK